MSSNKTMEKSRDAVTPQRSHGKARVAALLEAAAAIIGEKGYDATTMASIAARAKAPIGSLYRFFPNKKILADALVQRYAILVGQLFDAIDGRVKEQSVEAIADTLLDLMVNLQGETRAMLGLLEARSEWSVKRLEFREAALKHIAKTLLLCSPALGSQEARDVAVIVFHNMKAMKTLKLGLNVATSAGAADELRLMNRLYLANRLGPGACCKGKSTVAET